MNKQLRRISDKMEKLKMVDNNFTIFGSETHKYLLKPTISMSEVLQFEKTYNVILPNEYVDFVTIIGNGGGGPNYGLEQFENCLFEDLDYKDPDMLLNPRKPFLHTEPWNLTFTTTIDEEQNEFEYQKEYSIFEDKYFNKDQMNGVIAISNVGCGINEYLVVNGTEYGNIWADGRVNDSGIYPFIEKGNKSRITFLNWYELWLDNSLKEMNKNKKPWWRF